MPCIPASCQDTFSWMELKKEEKSSSKDICFRFSKKTDSSLFNKIRAFKKGRLERDVIQMDVENLDSGGKGETIIRDEKKSKKSV